MRKITTSSAILLGGSALYVADSFLPWNRACRVKCFIFTLWHGIGILAVLLAMGLLVWEGALWIGARPNFSIPTQTVSASAAGFVLFFTMLKIVVDSRYLSVGAWLGFFIAIAMAYGGYSRMGQVRGPPGPTGRLQALFSRRSLRASPDRG
jgi:hypothetical protein